MHVALWPGDHLQHTDRDLVTVPPEAEQDGVVRVGGEVGHGVGVHLVADLEKC